MSMNDTNTMIISQCRRQYPISIKLHLDYSNNRAKYKACIHMLEVVLEIWVKKLDVYGDLMLIIYYVKGEW